MVLNYEEYGTGPVIVLLHGMAGSTRYWKRFLPHIAPGHRIIALDLLGFGHSPKPKEIIYDYSTHIQSIRATLKQLGIKEPFTLAGHSMGGLIALKLAASYPKTVSKLIVIAMPVYLNAASAHQAVTGSNTLKELAYYGWTSHLLCSLWCKLLRPLSSRLAPFYLPHLPRKAAVDSLLHTWRSYSQSMQYVLENQDAKRDILKTSLPVVLVYGDQDIPPGLEQLKPLPANVKLQILPGTHQIVHEEPVRIAALF